MARDSLVGSVSLSMIRIANAAAGQFAGRDQADRAGSYDDDIGVLDAAHDLLLIFTFR